ncbi:HlyC/CorC family transporter [bacterium]|jgi:putative hemolysin|nr:HlyC/CorC family transporter [bacterium]MBT5014884.1 HlyC/CorC family transporter [bacterium]MBT6143697.1 HlyC/CorC family transporter [bacterium]
MGQSIYQLLSIEVLGFCIALLCTALFSFLETSITAVRPFKLKEVAEHATKYKSLLQTLMDHPHKVLITILVACSLASVTCAALATRIMEHLFKYLDLSQGLGFTAGIALATSAILIIGEIIPKNFAQLHGERVFKSTLGIVNIIYIVLLPIVRALTWISDFVISRFTKRAQLNTSEALTSEKELKYMIKYVEDNKLVESEKTEMLQNILEIANTPAREIMVPEIDIVSIDAQLTVRDALQVFAKHQFSRLPVYEKKEDNVIGMIFLKDVFMLLSSQEGDTPLKKIIRPVLLVPESIKVNQLLKDFRTEYVQMAIAINEHGSVAGLVTLEDVLEEIVGEITDENEPKNEKATVLDDGRWLVDASINPEELHDILGITFDTYDAITMGGFIAEQLQHVPKKGERVHYKDYCFEVHKASKTRVFEVLIFAENKADK